MNRNNKRVPLSQPTPENVYAFHFIRSGRSQNLLERQAKNRGLKKKVWRPASAVMNKRNSHAAVRIRWSFPVLEPWAAGNPTLTDEEACALIKRIAAIICYIKALNYSKQYLLDALCVILKHYTGLKDIKSISGINRAIQSELAKYGDYQLNRAELRTIWMV